MDQMIWLNIDAAIEAIRHGFAPWVCIVKIYSFEKRLRCQIVDIRGKPIIDVFCLSLADVVDPSKLRNAIQVIRARLEKKGFALEPWNPRW